MGLYSKRDSKSITINGVNKLFGNNHTTYGLLTEAEGMNLQLTPERRCTRCVFCLPTYTTKMYFSLWILIWIALLNKIYCIYHGGVTLLPASSIRSRVFSTPSNTIILYFPMCILVECIWCWAKISKSYDKWSEKCKTQLFMSIYAFFASMGDHRYVNHSEVTEDHHPKFDWRTSELFAFLSCFRVDGRQKSCTENCVR